MLLDLEHSFEELKSLQIAKHVVLPINADITKFQEKILNLKFPVWIKLNSSEHKLDLDAVKKCSDFKELEKDYQKMRKKFPGKKFIIQENIQGVEIITGIKQDKTFSKVLLLGAGGSQVEQIKDIEFRILPMEKEEILSAIKQLKIYKNIQNLAVEKLADLIFNFSKLKISEADLNPVILNSKEAIIVDARVQIEEDD